MKKPTATKTTPSLANIDLHLTRVTGGALVPSQVLNNDEWTRTGYGVIGSKTSTSYDPRDCD